jgi:hypothetical protein
MSRLTGMRPLYDDGHGTPAQAENASLTPSSGISRSRATAPCRNSCTNHGIVVSPQGKEAQLVGPPSEGKTGVGHTEIAFQNCAFFYVKFEAIYSSDQWHFALGGAIGLEAGPSATVGVGSNYTGAGLDVGGSCGALVGPIGGEFGLSDALGEARGGNASAALGFGIEGGCSVGAMYSLG